VEDLGTGRSGATPPDEEVVERLLSGMVNEAARCLEERVAAHADHVDLATVLGFGFPPFRGGLLRWARTVGEADTRRRLDALAGRHGARFVAAPGLSVLFRTG
jgi:3-hydroxyacyl-CoA dehydrogenase/enoyl-CoA hydratase/3-hydroxybutyryl-CoA epimerase